LANQINLILQEPLSYNQKVLKKAFGGEAKEILSRFNVTLQAQKPENIEQFHELLQDFVAQNNIGFGKIGQPLRVALLGDMAGAGLDEIMYILGLDEVTKRIQSAISFIESL
jgi:glutamyl-tRNA synthetase